MAEVFVRAARPEDVAEIGRIQRDTWRTAYARLLPPAVLEQLSSAAADEQWGAAVAAPPSPRHHVLVATEQQWTVGFVAFGPSSDEDAEPSTGAVATLLVEPRWGRRGHGSRLLAAAVDHLSGDGMTAATAWVFDRDRASRAFYTSAGWESDGLGRTLDADGQELREVRMHTDLSGA